MEITEKMNCDVTQPRPKFIKRACGSSSATTSVGSRHAHSHHKIRPTIVDIDDIRTNMQFSVAGKMINEKFDAIRRKLVTTYFVACQKCYTPVAPGEPCWNCGTMN